MRPRWSRPSVVKFATTSNGSLKNVAPNAMRCRQLLILIIDPTSLGFLNKKASRPKLRFHSLRIKSMDKLQHVLNEDCVRGGERGVLLLLGHELLSGVLEHGVEAESPGRKTAPAAKRAGEP